MTERLDSEVVVVGAGYAGLAAALALHDTGRDVVVMEARDRVGGRVHTEQRDGVDLDLGGMWVGATHDRFRELLERFALTTYPTPQDGRAGWWDEEAGRLRPYRLVPGKWTAAPAAAAAVARIERLVRRVPSHASWQGSDAERWDAVTVADWLRRRVPNRQARAALDASLVTTFSVETSQVSMHTLFTTAAGEGGLLRMLGAEGGSQQDLVAGGADGAARRMAELLGARLHLSTPAREVRHDRHGVTVVSDDASWTAQHAVVALPPAHVAALDWHPSLPGPRRQLLQRLPMGSVTKVLAVYDRPFWREAGWSGDAVDVHGPVTLGFDVSPPGGPPVLASLTCGRRSLELAELPAEERQQRVLDAFVAWFGAEAATPLTVVDRSWENETWSGGGYSAVPVPGTATMRPGVLAEPLGRVHFAGTETAARSNGYIEGALASGERAAKEITSLLDAP